MLTREKTRCNPDTYNVEGDEEYEAEDEE